MDSNSGPLLAPSFRNVSCSQPRFTHQSLIASVGPGDFLTLAIIVANILMIFVINHHRNTP